MLGTNLYLIDQNTLKLDADLLYSTMLNLDSTRNKFMNGPFDESIKLDLKSFTEYHCQDRIAANLYSEERVGSEYEIQYVKALFNEALQSLMGKSMAMYGKEIPAMNYRAFIEDLFDTDEGDSLLFQNKLIFADHVYQNIYFLCDPNNDTHFVGKIYHEIIVGLDIIGKAIMQYGVLSVSDYLRSGKIQLTGLYSDYRPERRGLNDLLALKYGGLGTIERLKAVFGEGWMQSVASHPRFTINRWQCFATNVDCSSDLQLMVTNPYEVVAGCLANDLDIIIREQVAQVKAFGQKIA